MTLMRHMFACAPRLAPTLDAFARGVAAEDGFGFPARYTGLAGD
jgi:hypothetical protein